MPRDAKSSSSGRGNPEEDGNTSHKKRDKYGLKKLQRSSDKLIQRRNGTKPAGLCRSGDDSLQSASDVEQLRLDEVAHMRKLEEALANVKSAHRAKSTSKRKKAVDNIHAIHQQFREHLGSPVKTASTPRKIRSSSVVTGPRPGKAKNEDAKKIKLEHQEKNEPLFMSHSNSDDELAASFSISSDDVPLMNTKKKRAQSVSSNFKRSPAVRFAIGEVEDPFAREPPELHEGSIFHTQRPAASTKTDGAYDRAGRDEEPILPSSVAQVLQHFGVQPTGNYGDGTEKPTMSAEKKNTERKKSNQERRRPSKSKKYGASPRNDDDHHGSHDQVQGSSANDVKDAGTNVDSSMSKKSHRLSTSAVPLPIIPGFNRHISRTPVPLPLIPGYNRKANRSELPSENHQTPLSAAKKQRTSPKSRETVAVGKSANSQKLRTSENGGQSTAQKNRKTKTPDNQPKSKSKSKKRRASNREDESGLPRSPEGKAGDTNIGPYQHSPSVPSENLINSRDIKTSSGGWKPYLPTFSAHELGASPPSVSVGLPKVGETKDRRKRASQPANSSSTNEKKRKRTSQAGDHDKGQAAAHAPATQNAPSPMGSPTTMPLGDQYVRPIMPSVAAMPSFRGTAIGDPEAIRRHAAFQEQLRRDRELHQAEAQMWYRAMGLAWPQNGGGVESAMGQGRLKRTGHGDNNGK